MEKRLEKIREVLEKGVEKIYPSKSFLEKKLLKKEKLKVYCGYDPTSPKLHLGHLPTLLKLAQFQNLGHEVIMLVGDFTGMIGDPTGKISARKMLSREEVISNSRGYKRLASKFLKFRGRNPARIIFNSQWLDKISFSDLINLASNFTVQKMIIRDFFQERIKRKKPIFLHEFLYPLAQAYDSVAMDVDLEIGGRDQIFNMLCGRDLMRILKGKEKAVMALKLLVDPTGKKMGKTEANLIALDEEPNEIYGKIMSWPDSLIDLGLELCTNLSLKEIKKIKKFHPRKAKAILAKEVVKICYDEALAKKAEREFERVFKEKKLPSQILKIKIPEKTLGILDLLKKTNFVSSKSEAKRILLQGGVKIEGKVERDWKKKIKIKEGMIVQIGKRKFAKIYSSSSSSSNSSSVSSSSSSSSKR
jgi:tyrosyl-tRNA synthetase